MIEIKCYTGLVVQLDADVLAGATFDNMNLHRADFDDADLSNASMRGTDLRGALLRNANLGMADLTGAKLMVAVLDGAQLIGTTMSGAGLNGTSLVSGLLNRAILVDADVGYADFSLSDLRGSDMRCQRIYLAKFAGAIFDESTMWPVGFDPESRGATLVRDGTTALG